LPWIDTWNPTSETVVRLVADLGPGDTGVLLLALERVDPVVILDDALARRPAAPGTHGTPTPVGPNPDRDHGLRESGEGPSSTWRRRKAGMSG
jgi:hypothetical protein